MEPEPPGAETFGRSRSWYIAVSAPAPGSGSAKVVNKNKNSYWIESSKWINPIFFHKKKRKIHFLKWKLCQQVGTSYSRSLSRLRSQNFLKVGAGAGAEKNSFSSTTLKYTYILRQVFSLNVRSMHNDLVQIGRFKKLSWVRKEEENKGHVNQLPFCKTCTGGSSPVIARVVCWPE